MNHPSNRAERLRVKKAKFEKTKEKDRTSEVRRKLLKEELREQETENELREAYNRNIS